MTTIVFCHPLTQSFNHQILDAITQGFTDEGREYAVINLYQEGFDPVLSASDLELQAQGKFSDDHVKTYTSMLRNSSQLILIFPIWWGTMPAMLKGFIDKTFIKGIAYDVTPEGALMPCLNITNTTVITTSEADSELFGNYITGYLTPMALNPVGITGVNWYNLDHISSRTDAERKDFTASILSTLLR